jgi:hypothetical protein
MFENTSKMFAGKALVLEFALSNHRVNATPCNILPASGGCGFDVCAAFSQIKRAAANSIFFRSILRRHEGAVSFSQITKVALYSIPAKTKFATRLRSIFNREKRF